ncbi:hypothetical protein CCACVL1_02917, partial [Corchorus capsularis]
KKTLRLAVKRVARKKKKGNDDEVMETMDADMADHGLAVAQESLKEQGGQERQEQNNQSSLGRIWWWGIWTPTG